MSLLTPQSGAPSTAAEQLAAVLAVSEDAIIATDITGAIQTWSRGAERIFEYSWLEIGGRNADVLWHEEWMNHWLQALRTGGEVHKHEIAGAARSGRTLDLSVDAALIREHYGAVTGVLLVVRDITRRKRAEETVLQMQEDARHRALILETANRVAIDILASRTGTEALRHIADAARVLSGARYAALGVARPDGKSLQEFITVGLTPEEIAAIGPAPQGHGVLGLLLHRDTPLRIDNLGQHPASSGFPPNHPPMQSFLGVPIRRGSTTVGSLYLTNKQGGGSFTEADEVAVEALGAHAAVAIHNLHMLSRQQSLVRGLIAAQEEERRAVAYDLHDGLTQYVMASHAHLESFKRAHAKGNEATAERELENGLKYLKEAVVESRRLVNGLRSLALDDLGLAGALEQLVNEEKVRAGWSEAELIHNIADRRFDKSVETAAYRVIQEALTNARKHAQTQRVQVSVWFEVGQGSTAAPWQLRIEVVDTGRGFVPEERLPDHNRVGLGGMNERVKVLSGDFRIRSKPGEGTTVSAIFPIHEGGSAADDGNNS